MISSFTIVADADLAREAAGANRLVGRVASGGVGQNLPALRVDEVEEIFLIAIGDVDATHGDSDDLGTALLDREFRLIEILVLAGPYNEARFERLLAEIQRGVLHTILVAQAHTCDQPPPTKLMSSSSSPSRSVMLA